MKNLTKGDSMKKYRLFGIINPLDVLILISVIALVVAGFFFAAPREASASAGSPTVRYTIELAEREEGFYKEITPGATVSDIEKGYVIGTIIEAYGLPYMEDAPDEDDEIFRRAVVDGLEFTYIVVEAPVTVSDYSTNIGEYSIAVNKEVFVKSKAFAGRGYITEIIYN